MANTNLTALAPAVVIKKNESSTKIDLEYDPWIDEPLTDEEKARLALVSLEDAVDW